MTKKIKTIKPKIKTRIRPRIDKFDAELFGSLFRARRPLSIKRLATRTDMSWQTANKHIKKLEKFKVLNTKKSIRKTNVFINPSLLKSLRKKR